MANPLERYLNQILFLNRHGIEISDDDLKLTQARVIRGFLENVNTVILDGAVKKLALNQELLLFSTPQHQFIFKPRMIIVKDKDDNVKQLGNEITLEDLLDLDLELISIRASEILQQIEDNLEIFIQNNLKPKRLKN